MLPLILTGSIKLLKLAFPNVFFRLFLKGVNTIQKNNSEMKAGAHRLGPHVTAKKRGRLELSNHVK